MGHVFEEICLQYLYTQKGLSLLPFLPQTMGRWWGSNAQKKREEEIDILGLDDNNQLFCECKWTNKLVDVDVFNALVEKSQLLSGKNIFSSANLDLLKNSFKLQIAGVTYLL